MNWVDGVLLAVLVLSAVLGLWRGLVYEVISVAGWVAAFLLAQAYADEVAAVLPMGGALPALKLAAGFALVFIATAFAGGLLAWLVKQLVASVGLRPIDLVLGGAFGLARGVLILLALTVVISMPPLRAEPDWRASVGAEAMADSVHTLRPLLPAALASYLP
jgi:membrane protein required for colicin V production